MTQIHRAPDEVITALSRKWKGEMNYSTCLKLCRMCFGPLTRVRPHNGGYRIYTEWGDTRTVHGEGATYLDAFKDAFLMAELPNRGPTTDDKLDADSGTNPPNVEANADPNFSETSEAEISSQQNGS